jgi:hypothetical protein
MFRSSRPSKNPTVSKDRAPMFEPRGLLTGAGRIPATVRQVFQLNFGASFLPEPEDESLVAVRDDAGVGVADKVVATNGLNPDRGSFIARRLVDWFALSPVISWRLELRTESAWAMGAFRGLG